MKQLHILAIIFLLIVFSSCSSSTTIVEQLAEEVFNAIVDGNWDEVENYVANLDYTELKTLQQTIENKLITSLEIEKVTERTTKIVVAYEGEAESSSGDIDIEGSLDFKVEDKEWVITNFDDFLEDLEDAGLAITDEARIKALVETAANAMKAGEFEKLQDLTVEDANVEGMPTDEMFDAMPEAARKQMMDALQSMTVEVSDIKVDGDTATGQMKMTFMGQTNEQEGKFRKVNGKWLIDG